jgi:hypothetical protein
MGFLYAMERMPRYQIEVLDFRLTLAEIGEVNGRDAGAVPEFCLWGGSVGARARAWGAKQLAYRFSALLHIGLSLLPSFPSSFIFISVSNSFFSCFSPFANTETVLPLKTAAVLNGYRLTSSFVLRDNDQRVLTSYRHYKLARYTSEQVSIACSSAVMSAKTSILSHDCPFCNRNGQLDIKYSH